MRKLENYKKLFYLKEYLKIKNRWGSVPPHILNFLNTYLDKITFTSNNPDKINGKIRRGYSCEYSSIEDSLIDLSNYKEFGIINISVGVIQKNDPDRVKISRKNKVIKLSFMPLTEEDYDIKCLEPVKKIKESDFMSDMLKGKIK